MNDRRLQIKSLRPGMMFVWCGRSIRYMYAADHEQRYSKRQGRWESRRVIVELSTGVTKGLHYNDTERVTVMAQPTTEGEASE